MATPIPTIPRDVLSIRQSNVTIHEGGRGRIGFPTKCGGINRGDIPRVPKAPRDVPEVDPDTRGQEKPYKHERGRLYCHYFCRMDNHPTGWLLLYDDTPRDVLSIWQVMTFEKKYGRNR